MDGRRVEVDLSQPTVKPGSKYTKKDAEECGPVLLALCQKHEVHSPAFIPTEEVVEAARDPASPLHKHIFRETDEKAAHERRLFLARDLCRAITFRVTIIDPNGDRKPFEGSYFVNVVLPKDNPEAGNRRGYVTLPQVMGSRDLFQQQIKQAKTELATWKFRWLVKLNIEKEGGLLIEQLTEILDKL